MSSCSRDCPSRGKPSWKMYVAVALAVAIVGLAVTLPTMFCWLAAGSMMAGNSSAWLAALEEALAVTNRSLAEAHEQGDSCNKRLGVLEGKVLEQDQELARVTQLQEENKMLKAKVAQQQEQLGNLQSRRDELQLQNELLRKQLQNMTRQRSGGNRLPAMSLSLLALLLPGMLLL